jgi:hypothetical protein
MSHRKLRLQGRSQLFGMEIGVLDVGLLIALQNTNPQVNNDLWTNQCGEGSSRLIIGKF